MSRAYLEPNWDFHVGKDRGMLAAAMFNSDYGKNAEENKKYLYTVC